MNIKSLYFNKRFWQLAIPLALPIAFQNLLSASSTMVDTFMVASLGDTALSAVGMASQFTWLFNCVVFGLGSGTALFVAQYWGTGDKKAIHKTEGIALTCATIASLVFCLAGFFASDGIISVFSRSPAVIEYGSEYLQYACWSYIPLAMSFVLCSILRSTESVKLPVIISLITSGFNIIFNYGLIGGNLGFPRMETAGAALATTIANWLGLLVLIVICMVQKNILRAPVKELLAFRWHNVAHFLRKAVPVICNESIWALGTVVMNAILSNIGDEYYAGVTILRTVENVAFVFAVGLCNACAILVGKEVGAGNIREAKETSLRFSFVMPLFSILTSACLILLRYPIVDLFTMNGEYSDVSVRTAVMCITTYACILPFRNVPYLNIVGVFRPAGDPRTGLICDMIPLWLIAIPVTAVMAFVVKLPFNLVFLIMYLCEDIPKASICIGYYLTDKWIRPVTEEGKAALEVFKAEKAAKKSVSK